MRIFSWNVNGLRAVLGKGALQGFIEKYQPDILCLQETKAKQGQAEVDFSEYEEIWNSAERAGYSGTAIFTKVKPLSVRFGFYPEQEEMSGWKDAFGDARTEGRVLTAEFEGFYLVNVYVPNEKDDLGRMKWRAEVWDKALLAYMKELGIRVRYLHSDIDTLERTQIIREMRLDVFDVLVGINLLREGLDIPEITLVAILDADKEGFLRSETSLIQTIGRAARNADGRVIMYADVMTDSMRRAIDETKRRRSLQQAYNEEHGITPTTIKKAVRDLISTAKEVAETEEKLGKEPEDMSEEELLEMIALIEKQMRAAAAELNFEMAAELRDRMVLLKENLEDASGSAAALIRARKRTAGPSGAPDIQPKRTGRGYNKKRRYNRGGKA